MGGWWGFACKTVVMIIVLFLVVHFMEGLWLYSMPEWMAERVSTVFAVAITCVAIFGFLAGGSFGGGYTTTVMKKALEWTSPFLAWPIAAYIVSVSPLIHIAPSGFEIEWIRAVAPALVTLGSWVWHRFSRLQEISRDAGAFVSPAIQIVSLFFAAQTNNIIVIGTSMVSASFAWYLIPVILQLTPHRSNLFYWLAFAFLTSGTICLLVG